MDTLQTDPDSASTADQVLANVAMMPTRASQRAELHGPQRHLKTCYLPTSAIFPHWGSPIGPDSAGITTQQYAWKWLYRQRRGKNDYSRQHVDFIHGFFICGRPKRNRGCEYPISITPQMAGGLAQVCHMVVRRTKGNADGRPNFLRIPTPR